MENITLISLKCSNCSAALQISDKLDRFICNYCGTEHALLHNSSGFYFRRLEERLENLEKVTEKGNAELAIKRLRSEVPGVNCQEPSKDELFNSLRQTLSEALEFNRLDALNAAGDEFSEEKFVRIWGFRV